MSMRSIGTLTLMLVATLAAGGLSLSAEAKGEGFPDWAFPGPLTKSVPGSQQAFADVQMFDRTGAVDWFPTEHPPLPTAVKGQLPVYACGFCHLPEGAGRPENAALAGLPYEYLKRQVSDMRADLRKAPSEKFGPAANMILTIHHKDLSLPDVDEALKYYSQLTYHKHTKVVEATHTPRVSTNSFVYVFDKSAARIPLGERIIEGPDDFERFEMRDPNVSFTAYVPVGAIPRGAAIAQGSDGRASCESCHGPGLKGSAIGPPIAGRPVTPTFRQLYGFQSGTRDGSNAALMKAVVVSLTQSDMIALAAYVGSLDP
jgi:cytochrome c553